MSNEAERQSINTVSPYQSNTPGAGVTILAATTTAANAAVPVALRQRFVFLQAEGDAIWVGFGANASPVIDKTRAGGATFAAGTNEQNAIVIPAGGRIAIRLSKDDEYLKWQANAANSRLLVYPASPARQWG